MSVIIPTLNVEGRIGPLVRALLSQTLKPDEVIVVDSSSEDGTAAEARAAGADVRVINRATFNHGLTRHEALLASRGDVVCFLTDDAVPASDAYLESLLAPLADPLVGMSSGRQLPRSDARPFERLVREVRYPTEPAVHSAEDVPALGIKAFSASDVCSAYRRSAYLDAGGFGRCDTNEDMLMAARMVWAGWKVAYAPAAAVVHSHNLTPAQQFRRNEAIGRCLEEHAGELAGAAEVGEGLALVRYVSGRLLAERDLPELAAFGADCAARLAGNRWGRWAAKREAVREARHDELAPAAGVA